MTPMRSTDAPTSTEGSAPEAAPDAAAFDTLYRRLRAICRHRLSSERVDHTLQATALANEVFLKLLSRDPVKARNPEGATRWFIANAVVAIREVLVDHARGRGRRKRGGGRARVDLDETRLDSLAAVESMNARIQRIKRVACGYRNRERFRNAILFHLRGLDLYPRAVSAHTKA